EAKTQLSKIYDASSSFFKSEHAQRGETKFLETGGEVMSQAPHRCPHPSDTPAGGEAGITPALDVNCNEGPGGRCVPGVGANGAGYYPIGARNNNAVWNSLNYMQEQGHYFHYNYKMVNNIEHPYGQCQFTAQAFADLDDDDIYSTYERSGAGDQNGVN